MTHWHLTHWHLTHWHLTHWHLLYMTNWYMTHHHSALSFFPFLLLLLLLQTFTPESLEFQEKIIARSGLGQQTYRPPGRPGGQEGGVGVGALASAGSVRHSRWL